MEQQAVRRSSPLAIALAWFIVIVPTGWGLTYTVQNALKIFTTGSPAPVSRPSAGGVAQPGK